MTPSASDLSHRVEHGLRMTTPLADRERRESSGAYGNGERRDSSYSIQEEPISFSSRRESFADNELPALGQPRTDRRRTQSFVEESDNTEGVGMLRTPQEVVTAGITNEPEIFTLFSMRGRSAIVTGGARGLGITLAAALVEAGADVYCVDILPEPSQEEWKALQHKAASQKVRVQYRQMDITSEEQTMAVFSAINEEVQANATGGRIKLVRAVLACAATQQEVPAIDYPVQDFERMMRINVTGTMITCQAAARVFRTHGRPSTITVIGSMSGRVANRGIECAAYNSTKAAVNQLVRNLACEWAQYKIRVNSISPGYIHTAMLNSLLKVNPSLLGKMQDGNPLHRVAKPHEFKGIAVYLASDASSFATGSDFLIDGGHCAW